MSKWKDDMPFRLIKHRAELIIEQAKAIQDDGPSHLLMRNRLDAIERDADDLLIALQQVAEQRREPTAAEVAEWMAQAGRNTP